MNRIDTVHQCRDLLKSIVTLSGPYDQAIAELAEPSYAAGNGRTTGVSDPTFAALCAGEPWHQRTRQLNADLVGIFHQLKRLEAGMVEIVNHDKQPTDRDRAAMRCTGEVDPLCTDLASVGPTGRIDRRGLCVKCYRRDLRAKKAAEVVNA